MAGLTNEQAAAALADDRLDERSELLRAMLEAVEPQDDAEDEDEEPEGCAHCHGTGGGDDRALRCPFCHGTGLWTTGRDDSREDYDEDDGRVSRAWGWLHD